MPEKFGEQPTDEPIESGDLGPFELHKKYEKHFEEYLDLTRRSDSGIDVLSQKERERFTELGYHYLQVKKNEYWAIEAFRKLQDFKGLRKVADQLLRERPDSFYMPSVLNMLEDHEGMRDLLNSGANNSYDEVFNALKNQVFAYRDKFLQENNMPRATGVINMGIDLVAIKNLSKKYNVAVPIARGGLNQGAIANLWEMPTIIVDVAAHNRKVARGKWVNPVEPEDFQGKNVLLFDKDAVTGASVKKIVKMLSRFSPASIGIYFAHNIFPKGFTRTQGLPQEIEVFCPDNAPMQEAGDAYIKAHERLGTQYGRRRLTERLFIDEAQRLEKKFPELSKSLKAYAAKRFCAFDSLNPMLPGILQVRERIISEATQIFKTHKEQLKSGLYELTELPYTSKNFGNSLEKIQPLPPEFETELIRARYQGKAKEAAEGRGVYNPHDPNNPLGAFSAARRAVKKGFNVALIVGPEGFGYEPYFLDLGMPTVAVNIPESGEGETRTIKLFDDLSALRGKKVLVVEDDIRTGATLQKLLEQIKPNEPAELDLYLGQSINYQKIENIPEDFTDTFVVKTDTVTAGIEFRDYLKSRGLKILKDQ